jgi:hypothetical protein
MLVLDALAHREQVGERDRAAVPVLVLVTLHGWDPNTVPFELWLAGRLAATYPGLGRRIAAELVATGRVAAVLDGLDEMNEALRPVALRALSRQARIRVVVVSRSTEMLAAAGSDFLLGAAAVELQPVAGPAAADYLTGAWSGPPPLGWAKLQAHLRNAPAGDPLIAALSTPLTLTLIRDTYGPDDDLADLLSLDGRRDRLAVEDHLLDRVVTAAYAHHPGEPLPSYQVAQAESALRHFAAELTRRRTSNLVWWQICLWSAAWPRMLATGIVFGFTFGFAAWLVAWRGLGRHELFYLGDLNYDLGTAGPDYTVSGRLGAVVGFLLGWLLLGLSVGLAAGLLAGLRRQKGAQSDRMGLMASWRSARSFGSTIGLLGGLMIGFIFGWLNPLAVGIVFAFVGGRSFGRGGELPMTPTPIRRGAIRGREAVAVGFMGGIIVFFLVGEILVGLAVWIIGGFLVSLLTGLGRPAAGQTAAADPWGSWRGARAFRLVVGPVVGLIVALTVGLVIVLKGGGPNAALVAGVAFGLVAAVMFGLAYPATWPLALAGLQLRLSAGTPARLMRFLEDARVRRVLRAVGPVYQFRHARLQERLAGFDMPDPTAITQIAPSALTALASRLHEEGKAGDVAGAAAAFEVLSGAVARVFVTDHPYTLAVRGTLSPTGEVGRATRPGH